jgi:hypothetical protein
MASSNAAPSGAPPKPSTFADDFAAGFKRWALAAVAAVVAESATFPIDFTKTRLQLQNELGKTLSGEVAKTKLGMVSTFRQILAQEGLPAMYSGLGASALRQAVYGGIGVGLYAPVRQLIIGDQDPKDAALWKRMLAGAITGSSRSANSVVTRNSLALRAAYNVLLLYPFRRCRAGDCIAN